MPSTKIFLCGKEEENQRQNRHAGHGHNAAPHHNTFRVNGKAQRQRDGVFF